MGSSLRTTADRKNVHAAGTETCPTMTRAANKDFKGYPELTLEDAQVIRSVCTNCKSAVEAEMQRLQEDAETMAKKPIVDQDETIEVDDQDQADDQADQDQDDDQADDDQADDDQDDDGLTDEERQAAMNALVDKVSEEFDVPDAYDASAAWEKLRDAQPENSHARAFWASKAKAINAALGVEE